MKKTVAFLFAGLLAGVTFAGKDNVVITFSTPGPDTYADKSVVADGECYALVWTKADSEFEGFNADGTAKGDSKVALIAPIAEGGKCPPVQFQIDEDYAKVNYPGGTWGVYLLDTRKFAADANGVILKDADGKKILESVGGKAVSGFGKVADADSFAAASASGAANIKAAVKAGAVKITDIKFVGDNVRLTVEGAVEGFALGLKNADTPTAVEGATPTEQYAVPQDGKMYLFAPKAEKGFFSL